MRKECVGGWAIKRMNGQMDGGFVGQQLIGLEELLDHTQRRVGHTHKIQGEIACMI